MMAALNILLKLLQQYEHFLSKTTIEILTPDFLRKEGAIEIVVVQPDVFNHNMETVPRLYANIRPGARYFHSLKITGFS